MKTTTYTYKSKASAVVLGLFLGGFGAHRFYLGNIGAGVAYLMATMIFIWMPGLFWIVPAVVLLDVLWIASCGKEYFKRETGYMEVEGVQL